MSLAETRKLDLLRALELIDSDVDTAHHIAQEYEGNAIADSIHAIVHRRDGDYNNSIYWWNRIGKKIPKDLATAYPNSDPAGFVVLARAAGRADKSINAVEKAEIDALTKIIESL